MSSGNPVYVLVLCWLHCVDVCCGLLCYFRVIFVNNFAFGPQTDHQVKHRLAYKCCILYSVFVSMSHLTPDSLVWFCTTYWIGNRLPSSTESVNTEHSCRNNSIYYWTNYTVITIMWVCVVCSWRCALQTWKKVPRLFRRRLSVHSTFI